MSQEQFQTARDLILAKNHKEARALLESIDSPVAIQWLQKLDKMEMDKIPLSNIQQFVCALVLALLLSTIGPWMLFGFKIPTLLELARSPLLLIVVCAFIPNLFLMTGFMRCYSVVETAKVYNRSAKKAIAGMCFLGFAALAWTVFFLVLVGLVLGR